MFVCPVSPSVLSFYVPEETASGSPVEVRMIAEQVSQAEEDEDMTEENNWRDEYCPGSPRDEPNRDDDASNVIEV